MSALFPFYLLKKCHNSDFSLPLPSYGGYLSQIIRTGCKQQKTKKVYYKRLVINYDRVRRTDNVHPLETVLFPSGCESSCMLSENIASMTMRRIALTLTMLVF